MHNKSQRPCTAYLQSLEHIKHRRVGRKCKDLCTNQIRCSTVLPPFSQFGETEVKISHNSARAHARVRGEFKPLYAPCTTNVGALMGKTECPSGPITG